MTESLEKVDVPQAVGIEADSCGALKDSDLEKPEVLSDSEVQPKLDTPAVADDEIPDNGVLTDFDNLPSEVQERVLWAEQLHAAGLHIVPIRAGSPSTCEDRRGYKPISTSEE